MAAPRSLNVWCVTMFTLASAGSVSAIAQDLAEASRTAHGQLRDYVHAYTSAVALGRGDRADVRAMLAAATRSLQRSASDTSPTRSGFRSQLAGMLFGVVDRSWLGQILKADTDHDAALVLRLTDEQREIADVVVPRQLATRPTWDVFDVAVAITWAARASRAPVEVRLDLLNRVRLAAPGSAFEEASWRQSISLVRHAADLETLLVFVDRYAARFPQAAFREQVCRDAVDTIVRVARGDHLSGLRAASARQRGTREQTGWLMLLLAEHSLLAGRIALARIGVEAVSYLAHDTSEAGQRYRLFQKAIAAASSGPLHGDVLGAKPAELQVSDVLVRQLKLVVGARAWVGSATATASGRAETDSGPMRDMNQIKAAVSLALTSAADVVDEVRRD